MTARSDERVTDGGAVGEAISADEYGRRLRARMAGATARLSFARSVCLPQGEFEVAQANYEEACAELTEYEKQDPGPEPAEAAAEPFAAYCERTATELRDAAGPFAAHIIAARLAKFMLELGRWATALNATAQRPSTNPAPSSSSLVVAQCGYPIMRGLFCRLPHAHAGEHNGHG